jgi:S1-C subfamily serine protease
MRSMQMPFFRIAARLGLAGFALAALMIVGLSGSRVRSDEKGRGQLPQATADLAAFAKLLGALYERVAPSTVNLFAEPKHEHNGSGVVVDAKGYVLTHAHGQWVPGDKVSAVFPDGKKVAGKVLGVHEPFDLSLVQLDGDGPWPAVPLGESAALKPGDACVMLGYPKLHHREGQPPLLRLGQFAGPWGHYLLTSCNLNGGDSGGPLFGLDGKLLGNNNLFASSDGDRIVHGTGHTSIDTFGRVREQLLEGRHVKRKETDARPTGRSDYPVPGPFEGVTGLKALADPAHKAVLTVLDGDAAVALGLVIDAEGWAITKASELPAGKVRCKLAGGRILQASVAGRDRDHDLALLKLPAKDLPVVVWADHTPRAGCVLATIGPEPQPLAVGIAASAAREVPGVSGVLAFEVAAADRGETGVRVTAVQPSRPRTSAAVQPGDRISRLEDDPTPDPAAFAKAAEKHLRGPSGRPGERVRLTIVRDGREQAVAVPVEAPYARPWSARHDGFPAAFVYDAPVLPTECGGPLVGTDGKVAGVVIARIGPKSSRVALTPSDSRTYAIPAEVVRKVVAELKRTAARGSSARLSADEHPWLSPALRRKRTERGLTPRRAGKNGLDRPCPPNLERERYVAPHPGQATPAQPAPVNCISRYRDLNAPDAGFSVYGPALVDVMQTMVAEGNPCPASLPIRRPSRG